MPVIFQGNYLLLHSYLQKYDNWYRRKYVQIVHHCNFCFSLNCPLRLSARSLSLFGKMVQIPIFCYPAVTYAATVHQGRFFWITCRWLIKASCLQVIQNSAPLLFGGINVKSEYFRCDVYPDLMSRFALFEACEIRLCNVQIFKL